MSQDTAAAPATAALPTAALPTTVAQTPVTRSSPNLLQQLGTDTTYLLATFPWTLVGFVVVLGALSVALPLVALGIGIPLTAASLAAARGFAAVERGRLVRHDAATGRDAASRRPFTVPARPRTGYGPAVVGPQSGGLWRRWVRVLTDGQSWLDALHGLTAWIVSLGTFCILVSWWAGAVGGLTVGVWDRFLPSDANNLDGITGAARDALELVNSTGFRFAGGLFLLLTLVPVTRGLARLQGGFTRALLGDLQER